MLSNEDPTHGAHFDADAPAIVVTQLTIADLAVVSEARRWSTGSRGETVDVSAMAGADLTAFVTQALQVGAGAIAAAGNAQDTFDLERLVTEVGTRAAESSSQAADQTGKAVVDAAKVITAASEQARKAITEAESVTRKSFAESVTTAKKDLQTEVHRLFGGDSPELLVRLQPILEKFGTELDTKVSKQTSELLTKAAQQFDPSDPTSPMAKQSRELAKQQQALSDLLAKNHDALTGKVEALVVAVSSQAAARDATTRTASVTTLKGTTYADGVHAIMQGVAAGLGDEYADTGAVPGSIARSKKGDGVLTVGDAAARVVLEMTDSTRSGWSSYLDEAERNRDASASLGLVRDPSQNAGQSIRVLGARRIVMTFDPLVDDHDLLRTVVMLLRTSAIAASSRCGSDEIATAEDKVAEAITLLENIGSIQKTAGSIRKGADKISAECDTFTTGIQRLLTQALDALAGAETATETPAAGIASGAA